MSTLYLLRHAKAVPALPGMKDFDRPLDSTGISDARAMGLEMKRRGYFPSMVICSSSRRTRETLDNVNFTYEFDADVRFSNDLYSANAAGYLQQIKSAAPVSSVLVIGHNPSTEELAVTLAGAGRKKELKLLMDGFATAALACFEFPGDLSHVAPQSGTLAAFIRPKHL